MNTYIPITKLVNTIPVYQVQPHDKSCVIMKVGETEKMCDVKITNFDYEHMKCWVTSKTYDIDELKDRWRNNMTFPIINMMFCKENTIIAQLSFNFCVGVKNGNIEEMI